MAAKTKYNCPNCGSTLYSGWANGDILVCRDNEDPPNGCLAAWPADLDASAETVVEGAPDTVEGAPQLGPPNEADIHANPPQITPDPDPSALPYEGPVPISGATEAGTQEEVAALTQTAAPTAEGTEPPPPTP